MKRVFFSAVSGFLALAMAFGCSSSNSASGFGASEDDGGSSGTSGSGSKSDASANAGNGDDADAGGGGTLVGIGTGDDGGSGATTSDAGSIVALYAHTDTTLYQLDPTGSTVGAETSLGDFDCIGDGESASAMTDLAVSASGQLYGISEVAVYPLTVTADGVHCTATWKLPSGSKFYGLTMAPANTVETGEVLIAANGAGELYKVDATTGATTQVGTFGDDPKTGKAWQLSGDIVFLANGGAPEGFATVRVCSSNCTSTTDTLIEVDVSLVKAGTQSVTKSVRGAVETGSWCTASKPPSVYPELFGIVAYEDKVYGFSRTGLVVEIHNDDATACPVSGAAERTWAGAGVTTSAPVVVPPPIR